MLITKLFLVVYYNNTIIKLPTSIQPTLILQVIEIPEVLEVLRNNSLYFRPFSAGNVEQSVHNRKYRCVAENHGGRVISRRVQASAGKRYIS